jgi:hypothetical protein
LFSSFYFLGCRDGNIEKLLISADLPDKAGVNVPSRLALSTLKAVLVIDLIIVAIAAPSYLYVSSLVPEPASFEVTDLVADQPEVQVGEPVQISVNVTNTGEASGEYDVILTIDNESIATETVQLSGGKTLTVVFTVNELSGGEHVVAVDELTKVIIVSVEAPTQPAELVVTSLGVSRAEAGIGEPIVVSATATNLGDVAGNFTLELFVNDEEREERDFQLGSGETETVQFEVVEESEGDYVVKVGTLTKSFKITSEAQAAKPAEFQVTGLMIFPDSVQSGETVVISASVTNVGEESGNYTVRLTIDGVERETKEVTLVGGESKVVEFGVTETSAGTHTVAVGIQSGSLIVENLAPASENVEIKTIKTSPYEVWEGDTVTITTKANNLVDMPSTLQVRVLVAGEVYTTKGFELAAGASNVTIELTIVAGAEGGYPVKLINLGNEENTLSGYFKVVPDDFHTLSVGSYPVVGIPFKLDGVEKVTPLMELLPAGVSYTLEVEPTYKSGSYIFVKWEDGSTSLTRTITLNERMSVTADYSGGVSCPSIYSWNGTGYYYTAEISNPGWLGYIGYITDDGTVVFVGGNPWDGVKLNSDQLEISEIGNNSYYDVTLTQKWDEIFYLDAAYLMVVDYPEDIDVYSTIPRYINPNFTDRIYTVSQNLLLPISAVNEKGEDVLSQISEMDGVFTPGINGLASESWDNGTWNRLIVNLGDLSDAEQIKLLIKGMVDWGPADVYYRWIDKFKAAAAKGLVPNGTQITPPPYIEVLDEDGNWVRVPEDRQMPIPADYVARPFVVDLTGIFPTDNYSIRINNFWNVTFDYVGIDTRPEESLTIQRIDAIAELRKTFETPSEAFGAFTKYGNVTELVSECDDKFVIGMQGDEVALLFPVEGLAPLGEDMKRTVFLFGACWFKDTPTNWGFGFDFTVNPLPFKVMSGFPYTDAESYPYDAEHVAYLKEYNIRVIEGPVQIQRASLSMWVSMVLLLIVVVDLVVVVYFRKFRR